jgi:lipopolysaccharide/colanic/teichoic acid biosynthesis glycosyltransferase
MTASHRAYDRTSYDRTKRILDALVAALALIVASTIMLAVAVVIAATMGHPVLFRQTRPGRRGELFELVKFRTMRPAGTAGTAGTAGDAASSDAERLTTLGRWLRAMSLDELPTFWNVVRGDMSLVGPRPLLVQYLDLYTEEQARRHKVRPGITGLAQVRGRNSLSWEEKFAYDTWYVDHRSLSLDMRILAETVRAVLGRKGISAEGSATAPEFIGSTICGSAIGAERQRKH